MYKFLKKNVFLFKLMCKVQYQKLLDHQRNNPHHLFHVVSTQAGAANQKALS